MQPRANGAAASGRLIIAKHAVGVGASIPQPPAAVALVGHTPGSPPELIERRLGFFERMFSRYTWVYEVDTARHLQEITTNDELPVRSDKVSFSAVIDVHWRVTDARTVVAQMIDNGDHLVRSFVLTTLRAITRRHGIDDSETAEREINQVCSGGRQLVVSNSGISIDRISARLTADASTKGFWTEQARIGHETALQDDIHKRDFKKLQFELETQGSRMQAIAAGVQGEFSLVAMHLMHHPDSALEILTKMHERQLELERQHAARFASSKEMFDQLLAADHVQDVDTHALVETVVRNLTTSLGPDNGVRPSQPLQVTAAPQSAGPAQGETDGRPPSQASATGSDGVVTWKPRKGSGGAQ